MLIPLILASVFLYQLIRKTVMIITNSRSKYRKWMACAHKTDACWHSILKIMISNNINFNGLFFTTLVFSWTPTHFIHKNSKHIDAEITMFFFKKKENTRWNVRFVFRNVYTENVMDRRHSPRLPNAFWMLVSDSGWMRGATKQTCKQTVNVDAQTKLNIG